jgi:hypothetical protein
MLKKFVIGVTIAGMLSAPSFAQKYIPELGSGNQVQGVGGPPVTADTPAYKCPSGEAYCSGRKATTGQGVRHKKAHRARSEQKND